MAACAMKASCQSRLARSVARATPVKSSLRSFRPVCAKLNASPKPEHAIVAGTAVATLLSAGSAQAAQEIAALASDSRLGTISLLFVPVLGWVGFNILGPAFRQLDAMSDDAPVKSTKRATRRSGIAAAIGSAAFASMMTVQSAEAASQVAQIADSDSRLGAILTLFVPVVGWVLFNIFGPASRQLQSMSEDNATPSSKTQRRRK